MEQNTIQEFYKLLYNDERPLTLTEASKYLSLSKPQLYRLTHQKKISFFKPNGKKIYFLKSDLNNYLLRNKTNSSFN